MKVYIPGPLRSYTRNRGEVEASGATVDAVLLDLDAQFPGIRFRMIDEQDQIRPHIKIYVNQEEAGTVSETVPANQELQIICAISGGAGLEEPRTTDPPGAGESADSGVAGAESGGV